MVTSIKLAPVHGEGHALPGESKEPRTVGTRMSTVVCRFAGNWPSFLGKIQKDLLRWDILRRTKVL